MSMDASTYFAREPKILPREGRSEAGLLADASLVLLWEDIPLGHVQTAEAWLKSNRETVTTVSANGMEYPGTYRTVLIETQNMGNNTARILPEGGVLYMYGPYKIGGRHTAPSNEAFDQSLRARDPSWGIRNLDDVALEARRRGLHLIKTVKMPANNLSVIYRKTAMVTAE